MEAADTITIATADEWADFWENNSDCCLEQVGDEKACLALAKTAELMIGGGAAPLFRVDARALVGWLT